MKTTNENLAEEDRKEFIAFLFVSEEENGDEYYLQYKIKITDDWKIPVRELVFSRDNFYAKREAKETISLIIGELGLLGYQEEETIVDLGVNNPITRLFTIKIKRVDIPKKLIDRLRFVSMVDIIKKTENGINLDDLNIIGQYMLAKTCKRAYEET